MNPCSSYTLMMNGVMARGSVMLNMKPDHCKKLKIILIATKIKIIGGIFHGRSALWSGASYI